MLLDSQLPLAKILTVGARSALPARISRSDCDRIRAAGRYLMTEPTETGNRLMLSAKRRVRSATVTRSGCLTRAPCSIQGSGHGEHLFRWHFVVLLAVMVFFGAIRWRLLRHALGAR